LHDESDAKTHRTPKHFVRNHYKPITVSRKLSEGARVSASVFGVGHVGATLSRGDGLEATVKGNT